MGRGRGRGREGARRYKHLLTPELHRQYSTLMTVALAHDPTMGLILSESDKTPAARRSEAGKAGGLPLATASATDAPSHALVNSWFK